MAESDFEYNMTEVDLVIQRITWSACLTLLTLLILVYILQIKNRKAMNKCTKYGTLLAYLCGWVSILAILISDVIFFHLFFFYPIVIFVHMRCFASFPSFFCFFVFCFFVLRFVCMYALLQLNCVIFAIKTDTHIQMQNQTNKK